MFSAELKAFQKASPGDLRRFGLTVGGVFVLLAFFFLWRQKSWFWWLLVPGVPLMLLGAVFPRGLKWAYVCWMALAIVMGAIISTILLTVLFYFVVTPIGLSARLAGKDFLSLKLNPEFPSYWLPRDPSKRKKKHEHERQF